MLERSVTEAIIRAALEELASYARSDAIVVGAGPAGLSAALRLAKGGARTLVLERRLSFGGGMGGGGMLMPAIVVEEDLRGALSEIGVRLRGAGGGLCVADPAEAMAKLASAAMDAGAKVLLGVSVEDVIYRGGRVCGAVCQWTAVQEAGMHVDPLAFECRALIDATGHGAEVCKVVSRKAPELGLAVPGEGAMDAEAGEVGVVERAGRVAPGLYVAGMAVAAVYRIPRMGPIFGGMFKSGWRAAEEVLRDLGLL